MNITIVLGAFLPVPGDVDVSCRVRGDRRASVQPGGELHQVPLRLEGGADVVEPGVEERRALDAAGRGSTRSEPDHMDATAFAEGKLQNLGGLNGSDDSGQDAQDAAFGARRN